MPGLRLADAPGETPEDQIVGRERRPRGGLGDGVAAAVGPRAGQVHDVAHPQRGRVDALVALGFGGNSGRAVQVLDEREVAHATRLKVPVEPSGGERERSAAAGTGTGRRHSRGTPEVAAGIIHLSPRPADGSIAPRLEVPRDAKRDPADGEDARSRHNPDETSAAPRLEPPASFDSPASCPRLGHGDDHVRRRRRRVDNLGGVNMFGRV